MALPKLYSPAEVADALGQTEHYVKTQCRQGAWPHRRVARGAIRMSVEDFAAVVELCAAPPSPARPTSGLTQLSRVRRRRAM